MKWLFARLRERSTWFGIFTSLGLFGMQIKPEFREVLIDAIIAVAAVVAFVLEEREPKVECPPIDFVARSEPDDRLPQPLSTDHNPTSGWNG